MTTNPAVSGTPHPPRLWPGVTLLVVQWTARFLLPLAVPAATVVGILTSMACSLLIVIWWLFASRLPWAERLLGIGALAVGVALGRFLLHPSLASASFGAMYFLVAAPVVGLALVAWAVFVAGADVLPRRTALVAMVLTACLAWALVRINGFDGNIDADYAWRWSPTAEQELVASGDPEAATTTAVGQVDTGGGWPGFRGPLRDSRIPSLRIATDWEARPPTEIWRRPVGPGWSSFAIRGDLLYTQEQRGEEEVVSAYRVSNGEPVWRHVDETRFWEAIGGPGPRATPTVAGDLVLSLGATGILNALDAESGAVRWSADAAGDAGAEVPTWGISGSPLVLGGEVIVAASGTPVAYDLATGARRWVGPEGGTSYSSPHLLRRDDGDQVLLLRGEGLVALDPADGRPLWSHEWGGAPIVQPAITDDGDVLIAVADRTGLRRLSPRPTADGWEVTEVWSTIGLKPYFNDFVLHGGHAYGFDGRILSCIDLATGERVWKGGRYGNGQLVLLTEQDLLLVLSEDGELVLVSATPDGFREIATAPALDGKTWNHPVLAGHVLLVRNGTEMAAFRLAGDT